MQITVYHTRKRQGKRITPLCKACLEAKPCHELDRLVIMTECEPGTPCKECGTLSGQLPMFEAEQPQQEREYIFNQATPPDPEAEQLALF